MRYSVYGEIDKSRFHLSGAGATNLRINAGWSSPAARLAHNQEVTGSNPVPAISPLTLIKYLFQRKASTPGAFCCAPPMKQQRSDRAPGARGAYEAARLKVLKTQTVCGICGKPVDFSYRYPHPLSPTVDHIIPVAKGGHPSDLSNLQLAHRCCNRQKSDKLIEPRKPDELSDRIVPNDMLEQHFEWVKYREG